MEMFGNMAFIELNKNKGPCAFRTGAFEVYNLRVTLIQLPESLKMLFITKGTAKTAVPFVIDSQLLIGENQWLLCFDICVR